MSSVASLAARFAARKPLLTAWCGLPGTSTIAVLAREDFDAVTIDLQHGAIDFATAVAAIPLVAAAGKPAIVRVPVGEYATASRLLDAGASAIIAPMINTAEDARRFASFVKFPPLGERSWGPNGALPLTGLAGNAYFAGANAFTLAIAMVETREALAAVDEILAVEGLDGIFIGPSDLSIALSGGRGLDPDGEAMREALAHGLARARAAGKAIGVYASSPKRGIELMAQGFDLIAIGSDTALLRQGAQAAIRTARGAAAGEGGGSGSY